MSPQEQNKNIKARVEWQCFSRPYQPPEKQVLTTLLLILILVSIILFFLRQFSLIAALVSFYFVYWVLKTVQPKEIKYTINEDGIWIEGKLYKWEDLYEFWLEKHNDYHLFFIRTLRGVSRIIILTVSAEENLVKEIENLLHSKLKYNPPQPSFVDKILNFINQHFDLNSST